MNSQNPITETQNENLSGSLKNPTAPQSWQPKPKSPLKRLFILVLLLAGVLGILYAYRLPPFTPNYVATNNAYVRGKATQVSPKVAGYVRQIMVQDYEWVEKGQPLVQIETDQYEMRLAQAQANVKAQEVSLKKIKQANASAHANVNVMDANIASAKASLENAKIAHARMAELVKAQAVSKQEYDNALTNMQKPKPHSPKPSRKKKMPSNKSPMSA